VTFVSGIMELEISLDFGFESSRRLRNGLNSFPSPSASNSKRWQTSPLVPTLPTISPVSRFHLIGNAVNMNEMTDSTFIPSPSSINVILHDHLASSPDYANPLTTGLICAPSDANFVVPQSTHLDDHQSDDKNFELESDINPARKLSNSTKLTEIVNGNSATSNGIQTQIIPASSPQTLQNNIPVNIPSPSATPTPSNLNTNGNANGSSLFTKPRSGSTSTVVGIPPNQLSRITGPPPVTNGMSNISHPVNTNPTPNPPNTNSTLPPTQTQPQPPTSTIFPALHLTPMNETFIPKQISLSPPGNRVKIGRQTNARTVPNERNGYFDSKVLSRMHAEVWCEDGKVFIKDVKSSNGTFINGERLSLEGVESDVFELHTDDIVVSFFLPGGEGWID
jgi:pSer/pThr/pTyr-binding forkhead associated (FHA) protein